MTGNKTTPNLAAWILAFFSFWLVITLITVIFLLTPHIQQVVAKQKVENFLATNNFLAIKDHISYVLTPNHPIENMFGREFAVLFNPDILERNQDSNLYQLVDALNFAYDKNYSAAYRLIDGLNISKYPTVIGTIQSSLKLLSSTQKELKALAKDKIKLFKQLDKINEAGNFIADDFGDFLTLKPVINHSPLEPQPVYTEGILNGLPKLQNLKNDINSLVELRDELASINGKVKMQGSNQYAYFRKTLADLNDQTTENLKEFDRVKLDYDGTDRRQKNVINLMAKQRNILIVNLSNVIKMELDTSLSPLSFFLEPFIGRISRNLANL